MTAELPQPQPTDAVIVGGARTPFTRLLSQQADLRAVDLGAHAITHALERAGVAPEDVDMVYMGQVVQAGAGADCGGGRGEYYEGVGFEGVEVDGLDEGIVWGFAVGIR